MTRPRTSPLLTPFTKANGDVVHLWTTFSADQVDLNYRSPAVFLKMVDVLLDYAARGARVLRLDAVAYLWKEVGTACIHLPETHLVVRLLRAIFQAAVPGGVIITGGSAKLKLDLTNLDKPKRVNGIIVGFEGYSGYYHRPVANAALEEEVLVMLRAYANDEPPPATADATPSKSGSTKHAGVSSHTGRSIRISSTAASIRLPVAGPSETLR